MAVRCHVQLLIASQALLSVSIKIEIRQFFAVLRFKTCSFILETKNIVFSHRSSCVGVCALTDNNSLHTQWNAMCQDQYEYIR